MSLPTTEVTSGTVTPLEAYATFSERLFDVLRTSPRGVEYWASPADRTWYGYVDLAADARTTAARLHAAGASPGDVAVLAFEPGPDFLRALLGALHAGLVVAPVPLGGVGPDDGARRLGEVVVDAMSTLVLSDGAGARAARAADLGADVVVDVLPPLVVGQDAPWQAPAVEPDDLVILQYTSGSTGRPKGVEITQGNLIANQRAIAAVVGSRPGSVVAGWLPHYHDMGLVGQIMHAWAADATLVVTSPAQFLRRPLLWLQMIASSGADITVAPDFAFALCAKLLRRDQVADLDLSRLAAVVTGSEPVRAASIAAFVDLLRDTGFDGRAFRPSYGMAETTLLVSGREPEGQYRSLHVDREELEHGRLTVAEPGTGVDVISCGLPAAGSDVRILRPDGAEELGDARIGEIWVAGASVARGYRNHAATAEDFGATLPGSSETYYRTGDLGSVVDGRLYVTGRLKELLIVRGRNLYPSDVEQAVVDAVADDTTGIAAASEGPDGRIDIVVEVRAATLRSADLGAVRARAARRAVEVLGTGAVDVHLVRRGSVPRTTSGKVRRAATRELLRSGLLTVVVAGDRA